MQPRSKSADYGPSWADVWKLQEDLMALHEWAITVEMSRPVDGVFQPTRGLWVRCVARQRVGEEGLYRERGSGRHWPCNAYRTMPAMLVDLLTDLGRKLDDTATDDLVGTPLGSFFCPPKVR